MNITKFVVKVNRGGTRAPEYVERIDLTPIQMTTNRKLALLMGRFTAEDAVKSIQNSRRIPELVDSAHSQRQPSTSAIQSKPGWSTFASGILMPLRHNYRRRVSQSR
jgi:hypothetical protein